MRIGILTHFHKSTNYGGVLQAYALCRFLNKQGHDARQILYVSRPERVSDARLTPRVFCQKAVERAKRRIYGKRNRRIKARLEILFSDFRSSVPHTEREYTRADIADANGTFDAFVTGSDQVWNPIWHDPSYFLDFADGGAKRISYAASVGLSALDGAQRALFQKYLPALDALSVRESAAAPLLSPLAHEDVSVSVDPTLLLTREDWDEIASERKMKDGYVFLYALGDDIKIRRAAARFAKEKGLMLVTIPDLLGKYRGCDRRIRAHAVTDATPGDFISLIKHADFVFTDSFHATVFSLLYGRAFFAFPRSGNIKMGSRLESLLDMFGCPERFLKDKKQSKTAYLLSLPAFGGADAPSRFEGERQRSVDYLAASLG